MLNVDIQEIFRLKDEDHLVDEIVEIVLDTKKPAREQETDKRNMLIQDIENHGCSHALIIDSDEYYTKKSFDYAVQQIDEHDYEITYCQYVNYYHDYNHYLKYPFKDGMYVPFVTKTKYRHSFDCTDFNKPSDPTRRFVRPYDRIDTISGPDGSSKKIKHYTVDYHIFEWKEIKMHHLSWLRADIRKKLENWSSKLLFDNYEDLIDKAVCNFNRFDENSTNAEAIMLFNTPDNKVEVAKFPKQFIFPKEDFNTRVRPAKDYKKLLVLSMSANLPLFNHLEEVSNDTWRKINREKYPDVNAEFWTYTDAQIGKNTYVDMDKHIIYIKQDTYFQNKLNASYSKTIEAFFYLRDVLKLDYDYLVRTNNSTWINIPLLNEFLAYENDDSKIYAGRLISAFFSAFNIFAGGQLMIFPKRIVNILLKEAKSVTAAKQFERKIESYDDNMIGGKLNTRFIRINYPYRDAYHSLGTEYVTEKQFEPTDVDFSMVAYQIKTGDATDDERMVYDTKKMLKLNKAWNDCDIDLETLRRQLIENHYDKTIDVIKQSKTEWFGVPDAERKHLREHAEMPREEAMKFLAEHQKKLGYTSGPYFK